MSARWAGIAAPCIVRARHVKPAAGGDHLGRALGALALLGIAPPVGILADQAHAAPVAVVQPDVSPAEHAVIGAGAPVDRPEPHTDRTGPREVIR